MNFRLSKIDKIVLVLLFALLAVFLIHNFDSIGQDIGRHLKMGEIIWQTQEVPKTNLFSFTEPDFPFLNHHWLSEVIFFGIFSKFGFVGLILIKALLVLAAFLLLFSLIKKHSGFWPFLVSFLFSIFIFIQRTEVRPEIFSLAVLAFFLFAIFKSKYENNYRYLWFLPLAQLLWVNLHIYFFIGPFLVSAFFIDRLANKDFSHLKKIAVTLFLTLAATLINPAGIRGALLPFNILQEYGYSIVENQTLSFLAAFFGFNLSIFIFKISVAVLIASIILRAKKLRYRIFEILISIFFIYAGFRMLRNLPLYALASFPVSAFFLTDIQNFLERKFPSGKKKISSFFKILISVFLVFLIFLIASGRYYNYANLSREFGFSVPNGLDRTASFVKENKIEGPMFNNFDIGGFLIWKLYSDHKVFVDNRPEAYSVKFFSEIYKPMQEDEKKWAEFSEEYGINYIFFGHTDFTPWGQAFMKKITKNPDWKIVYVNENAIILLKDNSKNAGVISRLSLSEDNAAKKVAGYLQGSGGKIADINLVMSRLFYNINWREASLHFSEKTIKADPTNKYAHLNKGLVHAHYTDIENQKIAAENIGKAIDLGLKDSQYYYILGVIYMNLGQLDGAERLFNKALELDENNEQAREFLDKYF